MPLVRIETVGPQSAEYSSAVLSGVRAAVTGALGVPDSRVTLRIHETPAALVDLPEGRTNRFTVVEIALYAGRTPEMKAACIAAIRANLADEPGIPAHEIAVHFTDASPHDLDAPAPA